LTAYLRNGRCVSLRGKKPDCIHKEIQSLALLTSAGFPKGLRQLTRAICAIQDHTCYPQENGPQSCYPYPARSARS
jgi:hypothetical protein